MQLDYDIESVIEQDPDMDQCIQDILAVAQRLRQVTMALPFSLFEKSLQHIRGGTDR